jgi:hypothetical protein
VLVRTGGFSSIKLVITVSPLCIDGVGVADDRCILIHYYNSLSRLFIGSRTWNIVVGEFVVGFHCWIGLDWLDDRIKWPTLRCLPHPPLDLVSEVP